MTIANTILDQLGGRQFIAMTGAKDLVDTGHGLRFKLPSYSGQKTNCVHIQLDPSDTYTPTGYRVWGINLKVTDKHEDIYNDMLQKVFTQITGLDTHL